MLAEDANITNVWQPSLALRAALDEIVAESSYILWCASGKTQFGHHIDARLVVGRVKSVCRKSLLQHWCHAGMHLSELGPCPH